MRMIAAHFIIVSVLDLAPDIVIAKSKESHFIVNLVRHHD